MSKLENTVVELVVKLEALARDTAPEAWAAARSVVQVDALGTLTWGLTAAAVAAAGWVAARYLFGAARARALKDRETTARTWASADDYPEFFFGVVLAAVALASTVLAALKLLSPWPYAALFRPELVIARRVLDGLL